MKIEPALVGFSGKLVSMLSLILIKSLYSTNSNHEILSNKILNRFDKSHSGKLVAS